MKHLYQSLQLQEFLHRLASGSPFVLLGFFFYERGASMLQKSREGLIRAILYQVLKQRQDLVSAIMKPQRINLGPLSYTGR